MSISLIEFGLSQFGEFEFAHEVDAGIVRTAFAMFGQGDSQYPTFVVTNIELNAPSQSFNDVHGQAVTGIELFSLDNGTTVKLPASTVRNTTATAKSVSDAFFMPGYVIDTGLYIQGTSNFSAYFIDPETLDIRGSSTVLFMTGLGLVTEMKIKAVSEVVLPTGATSTAVLNSAGVSGTSFRIYGLLEASFRSNGVAQVNWVANRFQMARVQIQSNGRFTVPAQTVKDAATLITSQSLTSIKAQGVATFNLSALGLNTYTSVQAQAVELATFNAAGLGIVHIKPGSAVFGYLPYSTDYVIRPYEFRGAVWK